MKKRNSEEIYRHIAGQYVESYGEQLKKEQQELTQSGVTPITPGLDRKVRRISRRKNRRFLHIGATIAACLALAVMAPFVLRPGLDSAGTPSSDASSSAPAAPDSSDAPAPQPVYEILPLSFTLPEQFSVDHVELDRERSVYYLADSLSDDVVLVLEKTDRPIDTQQYTALKIGGHDAYAYASGDYNLITFQYSGIRYEMTCAYDINTLVELGESILV